VSVAERREREKEERRNNILDAAQRVFYAKGLDQATMEEVASEAHLGKGTLYLYFRNKDDLLAGIVARRQEMLLAAVAEAEALDTGLDHLRALLINYARAIGTPREHLQMAMSRWVSATRLAPDARCAEVIKNNMRQLFGGLCNALARGQQDGTIRGDRVVPRMALQLWTGVNGALLLQLQLECIPDPSLLPPAPSLEEAIDGILDAVRTDDGEGGRMMSGERMRAPELAKEA
jgi:AcrR family transcriptional regulator